MRSVDQTLRSRIEIVGSSMNDRAHVFSLRGWLIERARVRRLRAEIETLREAVRKARPHVYRQLHGRHEQDQADARAWLEAYGPRLEACEPPLKPCGALICPRCVDLEVAPTATPNAKTEPIEL